MKLQIFHTVNAGLYIWNGMSGLLVDALHGGSSDGFSDTREEYLSLMRNRKSFFGQTNDVLLTHLHPDHYDAALTEEYLELYPDSRIYGPGLPASNVWAEESEPGIWRLSMRGYTIHAFRTLHDGKPYEGESHLSYLITSNGQNLWISGDAVFTSEDVERVNRIAGEREIDAAFVMVYQIGNRARQQIL